MSGKGNIVKLQANSIEILTAPISFVLGDNLMVELLQENRHFDIFGGN